MPDKPPDCPTVARQVELAVSQLNSLSILPSCAARVYSELLQAQAASSVLAEVIESDPALAAKVLSLIPQQGLSFTDENLSLRRVLDKLAPEVLRDALLSVSVLQPFDQDKPEAQLIKEVVRHSFAVACAAKEIAAIISPQKHPHLVYMAGLLHDMGKLALYEVMPKSFLSIVEEAKSTGSHACTIERKHLGLDHTILGKRLALKWGFPDQVALAVWLHHSSTDVISQTMPQAKIAQFVQLADSVARQCGIGQSGSYDEPVPEDETARSLGIAWEQLEQIRRDLPATVRHKSEVLGLDSQNAAADYCSGLHSTAAQLARDNTELSLENRRLHSTASHFHFIEDFLSSINANATPIEIAHDFAVRWQKFYQTGKVCLYLAVPTQPPWLEAAVVEPASGSRMVVLHLPGEIPPVPEAIAGSFAVIDAHDYLDWLFEQLDVPFDSKHTKLMPLLANRKAIGAIAFELRYPEDIELFREQFRTVASIGGSILSMALAQQRQQLIAEHFAEAVTGLRDTRPQPGMEGSLNALAEMAGGAAHELNNPLSVIAGRAQLLAKAETDPEKQRALRQIREKIRDISTIIEGLASFAAPPQPRPERVKIEQTIDEAMKSVGKRHDPEHLDVQIEIDKPVEHVYVDPGQMVSALANILSNAVESYTDEVGPVKVVASAAESADFVKLTVTDFGCGMDAETVQKATHPFFSAKPAGRKHGMGLAHAARLIQINKGSLHIASEPGSGTTVTIYLPRK
jgi:putative nucleotidyltransferase with HDIG domain